MKTRSTFEEALEDAKKYTGSNPSVLALPKAFKTASVHLCMDGVGGSSNEDLMCPSCH